jgi:hypothetical protein
VLAVVHAAGITSEQVLRRLAIGDPAFCRDVMAGFAVDVPPGLDARGLALLRLGGSIGAGPSGSLLRQRVGDALAAGLSFDEVVASLMALAPTIGIERTVALAPELALALDYDIDAALESLDR